MITKKVADQRQHLLDKAAKTGIWARSLSIGANLATVPLVMSALGAADYAIWVAITSLLSIMQFLDFGIGNSAMGKITEALALGDHARAMQLVRHTYIVLGGIATVLLLVTGSFYVTGLLEALALSSGSFLAGHINLMTAFIACYALVIPATFVQRLLFAHQQAGVATILQLAFSLLYLCFAAIVAWRVVELTAFVLGYVLLMVLVYGGYSLWYIRVHYSGIQLCGGLNYELAISLLKGAGLFFLLQITVALVYNSDNLILTAVAEPENVAMYATTWRMFSLVVMVNNLILGPLWPAVADAKAKGEYAWLKSAYLSNLKRSMGISLFLALMLVFLGDFVLNIWTGGRIKAPIELLAIFALWVLLEGYGQCMAMLLNGLHILRLQLIVATLLLLFGMILKLYLADRIGFYGPIIGTIVAFIPIVAVVETIFIHQLLKRNT